MTTHAVKRIGRTLFGLIAVRTSPRWLSNSPARPQTRMFPAARPLHRVDLLMVTSNCRERFSPPHGLYTSPHRPPVLPSSACQPKICMASPLSPAPPRFGRHHMRGGACGAAAHGIKNLIRPVTRSYTRYRGLLAASSRYSEPHS